MNRIWTIGRRIALLVGLAAALLGTASAVPAFARPIPPGSAGPAPASPAPGYIVAAGMPGWQIALIAVGAAVLAAVVAVCLDRVRAARRGVTVPQRVAVPGK